MKTMLITTLITLLFSSCGNNKATQISDNTFVYKSKIYKVVGNKLTELADLDSKNILKLQALKPQEISLGEQTINFVKADAKAKVDALYRGDNLYFRLTLTGINDLKDHFYPGKFTLEFLDEFGFILNAVEVSTSDLIGIVGDDRKVNFFMYNGKIEMSSDITSAIKSFSISSTVTSK